MKKFIALLALGAAAVPSLANDSSAAIGLGGLELTRNDAISMDSEELFLSRQRVSVKYRFTNSSDRDIETLVSFPLPMLPPSSEAYMGDQPLPDWQADLDFRTLVDGSPVKLDYHEAISLPGNPAMSNVEGRLKALGWPVRYWADYRFEEKLQELGAEQKAAYVAEGLLRKEEGADWVYPNWQVTTHVTRKQRFPAGKTIIVEHSYKPVAGGSVGGILNKQYREGADSGFADYAKTYCIDTAFLKGFDKRYTAQQKKAGDEYGVAYTEHWLDYVLKSGANWKGPIKDFRLIVEKEKPENLVSFCMDGVKKIGPTRFEVRKKDFEPSSDLKILIVEFYDPSDM